MSYASQLRRNLAFNLLLSKRKAVQTFCVYLLRPGVFEIIKRMVRPGQSDLSYNLTADGTIKESNLTTWKKSPREGRAREKRVDAPSSF
jgi:hypothetical protein